MKTTILTTLVLAVMLHSAPAATNDTSALLRQGLFEEEANHDLDAAIRAYQAVVTQHDDQRKVAATAIFRLGECYRKQGKTNEAIAQFQRIVAEFNDLSPLAGLSRTSLAALAPAGARAEVATTLAPGVQQQKDLLQQELELVEKQLAIVKTKAEKGLASEGEVLSLQRGSVAETPDGSARCHTPRIAGHYSASRHRNEKRIRRRLAGHDAYRRCP